jgi:hypothetical protein
LVTSALFFVALGFAPLDVVRPEGDAVAAFAIVVGNNQSLSAARPDLRYADDDAVKLAALLEEAGGVRTVLLTRPDGDTAGRAPRPADGAPARASLFDAAVALGREVGAARAAGRSTRLLFAFAGHGDVIDGKGTLELEDGALLPDDVRALLDAVDADESHLLLDSCNSFFVVHPRRPGGRAFATKKDAGAGIVTRRGAPNVFLSTSAEAQVWEWSQLEGGIFSHAVRSGLAGGADANGDARVTYGELSAFVETATADVDSALYRPRLYVRAAGDDVVLFELRRGRALSIEGFVGRVTVRDGRGVRLLDVHPATGFAPTLRVPAGPLEVVAERTPDDEPSHARDMSAADDARRLLVAGEVTGDVTVVRPGDLVPSTAPRGLTAALEKLFLRPFGPGTPRPATADDDDEVYGLTVAQEQRIALQLEVFADDARRERLLLASIGAAAAATSIAFSAGTMVAMDFDPFAARPEIAASFIGMTAALAVLPLGVAGSCALFCPFAAETVWRDFEAAPHATPRERAARAAVAVEKYARFAEDDVDATWIVAGGIVTVGLTTATMGWLLTRAQLNVYDDRDRLVRSEPIREMRTIGAVQLASGVGMAVMGASLPLWGAGRNAVMAELLRGDPEPVIVP